MKNLKTNASQSSCEEDWEEVIRFCRHQFTSATETMAFHLRRVANLGRVTKIQPVLCLFGTSRRYFCLNSSTMDVADLSDAYSDTLQYVEPNLFRNYGGKTKFGGMISTLKVHEDNLLVKKALSEPGNKRVRNNVRHTRKKKLKITVCE